MATKRRPKRINITPSTLSELEKHAYSNLEAEVGGMFFGKIVDGQTRIAGFIPALTASAEQISLTFTHEVWDEILREGSKKFPDDQIVGWYHTHPSFGLFLSEYDLFIQTNFFGLKGQLALVLDPIAGKMGWFESSAGKAKMIFEEPTNTGPKTAQVATKAPKALRKVPVALVATLSAALGVCVGAGLALANMPPNLSEVLLSTQGDRDYFEQQAGQFSDLLSTVQSAPVLVYTVREGDTLESVVLRFYGSEDSTQVVKDANTNVDFAKLVVGSELRLPGLPGVTVELTPPAPEVTPEPTVTPSPSPSN